MIRYTTGASANTLVAGMFGWLLGCAVQAENWPGWRGPRGDGTSLEAHVPLHWSGSSNAAWKAEVPGVGHASPIVWGDRVLTVSALLDSQERVLLCYDRRTGRALWQRTVVTSPLERKHTLNSFASSTPATDGNLVYVAFLDVQQMTVAAYDLEGKQRWLVQPGVFKSMHGFCSSPVLFKDKVIVNGDHDGDSYVVALSRADGRTLWKTARDNHTRSYCTPTIFDVDGRTQMVMSGDMCVASFDPETGARQWLIDGPTEQFVASIVYNAKAKLFFMTGGYPDHHLLAIRPDGRGNITQTHVAWHNTRASCVSYVPSPIAEGDYFLVVSDPGYANCFDAATGRLVWQEKVGEHHASLVSSSGLVYLVSDEGVARVVRPGPKYECLATDELGERCFASPALSQGQVFLRGDKHLFAIGSER
jgi:outer membrane protein assembly factor BamB